MSSREASLLGVVFGAALLVTFFSVPHEDRPTRLEPLAGELGDASVVGTELVGVERRLAKAASAGRLAAESADFEVARLLCPPEIARVARVLLRAASGDDPGAPNDSEFIVSDVREDGRVMVDAARGETRWDVFAAAPGWCPEGLRPVRTESDRIAQITLRPTSFVGVKWVYATGAPFRSFGVSPVEGGFASSVRGSQLDVIHLRPTDSGRRADEQRLLLNLAGVPDGYPWGSVSCFAILASDGVEAERVVRTKGRTFGGAAIDVEYDAAPLVRGASTVAITIPGSPPELGSLDIELRGVPEGISARAILFESAQRRLVLRGVDGSEDLAIGSSAAVLPDAAHGEDWDGIRVIVPVGTYRAILGPLWSGEVVEAESLATVGSSGLVRARVALDVSGSGHLRVISRAEQADTIEDLEFELYRLRPFRLVTRLTLGARDRVLTMLAPGEYVALSSECGVLALVDTLGAEPSNRPRTADALHFANEQAFHDELEKALGLEDEELEQALLDLFGGTTFTIAAGATTTVAVERLARGD